MLTAAAVIVIISRIVNASSECTYTELTFPMLNGTVVSAPSHIGNKYYNVACINVSTPYYSGTTTLAAGTYDVLWSFIGHQSFETFIVAIHNNIDTSHINNLTWHAGYNGKTLSIFLQSVSHLIMRILH
jgi:hypothetical protein